MDMFPMNLDMDFNPFVCVSCDCPAGTSKGLFNFQFKNKLLVFYTAFQIYNLLTVLSVSKSKKLIRNIYSVGILFDTASINSISFCINLNQQINQANCEYIKILQKKQFKKKLKISQICTLTCARGCPPTARDACTRDRSTRWEPPSGRETARSACATRHWREKCR